MDGYLPAYMIALSAMNPTHTEPEPVAESGVLNPTQLKSLQKSSTERKVNKPNASGEGQNR